MSLPPSDWSFHDEEEDRKRRAAIEEMMRSERERYFREEPVQQEYRDILDRKETRRETAAREAREPGPFEVALARFVDRRAAESANADSFSSQMSHFVPLSISAGTTPPDDGRVKVKPPRLASSRHIDGISPPNDDGIGTKVEPFSRGALSRDEERALGAEPNRQKQVRPAPVRVVQNRHPAPAPAPSQRPPASFLDEARPGTPATGRPLPESTPPAAADAKPPVDRIFVTYNETTVPGTFHAAVHYQRIDTSGKVIAHQVVEAKPERGDLNLPMKVIGTIEGLEKRGGPTVFGNILGEIRRGEPDDEKLPYQIIAEDHDLGRTWQKILDFVDDFNTKGHAYRGERQNSNTFASAALRAGGLPAATGIGTDPTDKPGNRWEYFPPGLNQELDPPVGIRK